MLNRKYFSMGVGGQSENSKAKQSASLQNEGTQRWGSDDLKKGKQELHFKVDAGARAVGPSFKRSLSPKTSRIVNLNISWCN